LMILGQRDIEKGRARVNCPASNNTFRQDQLVSYQRIQLFGSLHPASYLS
jgi:hypothetical protein